VLYLHFKGYMRIQNLEPYTAARAIFLESNNLRRIEGLESLVSLRALYLQQNAIKCVENLGTLSNLNTLNLSQNAIERLEPGCFDGLHSLSTLILSKNRFMASEDVSELSKCSSLTNLDLGNNDIEDEGVVEIVSKLPALACLVLTGNPFLRTMRQYRKTVLSSMPTLTHLDDRPVFEEERVAVAAWSVGGAKAERDAREAYRQDQRKKDRDAMEAYREWVERKRQERALKLDALNAERAEQGLEPLSSLPLKASVRYHIESASGRDEVGGVVVEDELEGGVLRDRSDRRIGVVPGAAQGISPEAAAMVARIERGEPMLLAPDQEATTGVAAAAAAAATLPVVSDQHDQVEASADTAELPPTASVAPPLPPQSQEGEEHHASTMSEEQHAVYQSLRIFNRRQGLLVPESTDAASVTSRTLSEFDDTESVSASAMAASARGADVESVTSRGTEPSVASHHMPPPGEADEAMWTPQIDQALRKLATASAFDWRKAASALQKAIRTGRIAPPPATTANGLSLTRCASLFTPDAVRMRFAGFTAVVSPPFPPRESLRARVAKAGPSTSDTAVATAVALTTAARGSSVLPVQEGAIPLDRLLRGPTFELAEYSHHVKPDRIPSVADWSDDEDEPAAATDAKIDDDASGPVSVVPVHREEVWEVLAAAGVSSAAALTGADLEDMD
jgi:hypothetical protein